MGPAQCLLEAVCALERDAGFDGFAARDGAHVGLPRFVGTLADWGATALRSRAHNRGISMYVFLAGLCCAAVILILTAALPSLAKKPSADAQFKALYTKEWKWRDDQFPGGEDNSKEIADHLPMADEATQQMRLNFWEGTMQALDAIPR